MGAKKIECEECSWKETRSMVPEKAWDIVSFLTGCPKCGGCVTLLMDGNLSAGQLESFKEVEKDATNLRPSLLDLIGDLTLLEVEAGVGLSEVADYGKLVKIRKCAERVREALVERGGWK